MATFRRRNKSNSNDHGLPSGLVGTCPFIYKAEIMANDDFQSMGRLRVHIRELQSRRDNEDSWLVVQYCSPFAGATPIDGLGNNHTQFDQTQTSYGMWMIPPDIGNTVFVFFVNADVSRGYWFGGEYQTQMNNCVPDKFFETNYYSPLPAKYKSLPMPTADYNKRAPGIVAKTAKTTTKPMYTPYYKAIAAQGLIKDNVRGRTQSSAKRDTVSQVYGITTPGPINPKSINGKGRLGGHSFVMDDKEGSEHITLKTRSGAQIRIDETNGLIYVINKRGTAWIQLDADGNGDMFFANDFSVRALRDINLRADRDVNIESGRNINISALKDYASAPGGNISAPGGGSGGKVNVRAYDVVQVKADQSITLDTPKSFYAKTGENINLKAGVDGHFQATGLLNLKADSALHAGGVSLVSLKGALVAIDGMTNVNNGMSVDPTASPELAPSVKEPAGKTNVLKTFTDEYNIDRNTQDIQTTVERLPTFEPCPEHTVK